MAPSRGPFCVWRRIANQTPSHIHPALAQDKAAFDRLADQVAAGGGSWGFIIGFGLILTVWMGWNTATKGHPLAFDPYPFIFLNLMLSMLAAIQAAGDHVSQNRAAARDQEAAGHDYTVNLRAELAIMHLHDKIDTMREKQMFELLKQQRQAIRLRKSQVERCSTKGEQT
jgi:uncharacterized membrane protein